ncbi:MAG TPA: DUF4837 family protein [Candidatus Cloacimonadota bacterium]|nr:DUF4837 family protein [Candidatus Cloacimonadota bacterium]
MKAKTFLPLTAILLVCVLVLFPACGTKETQSDKYSFYENTVDNSKPIAMGDSRDIYVFADASTWKILQNFLTRNLERETFVVVNEKYFRIIKSDIKNIDELMKYKNLLFLGDLKSKEEVSTHMRKSLDKQMLDKVQKSGAEMFVARNRWVKDQLIVYMMGSNLENLLKLNLLQADQLYNLFLNRLAERLAYQAYQTKIIPEDFFQPYPFSLKVPSNFQVYANDKENHFLSFLYRIRSQSADFPDRYLSIYYEDMPQDSVNLNWLMQKRQALANKYYQGDKFIKENIRSERFQLGKYNGWRILGPWQNDKFAIGGGFQAFAFYEPQQKKAYLIDNSVYFPAGDKLPELLLLQKISETFTAK